MNGFYAPFTERGFVVFAVVHGSQPKFTIPEIRLDINRAVRFIRTHAADWEIDPDRLGITGGSAGGHLSCLQGCGPLPPDEKSPDPAQHASSKVQAVACLFPPTDFLNWGEKNLNALDVPSMTPFVAAFDFHELDPKTHLFMRIVDRPRVAALEKEISPITHVSKDSPPILIIHGDEDKLVPIQQSQMLIDKLKEAKVPAELIVKKGAGHGWADTKGDMQKMAEWFEKYLLNKKD
jgi:acetyl esterase/lipase